MVSPRAKKVLAGVGAAALVGSLAGNVVLQRARLQGERKVSDADLRKSMHRKSIERGLQSRAATDAESSKRSADRVGRLEAEATMLQSLLEADAQRNASRAASLRATGRKRSLTPVELMRAAAIHGALSQLSGTIYVDSRADTLTERGLRDAEHVLAKHRFGPTKSGALGRINPRRARTLQPRGK